MTIKEQTSFNSYKTKQQIYFSYKKHTTPETSTKRENDWKGKSFWQSEPNLKAFGVAILLKENLNSEIIKFETDSDSRIIKCILQIEKQIFQLINIYAPTKPKNKKTFYKELPKFIEKENNTILAADFNMIEDFFSQTNQEATHLCYI